MKFNSALELSEMYAGLAPPTQLAPYQDLNYQMKHWAGTRPEHKPKKKYITQPKKKRKKKKKKEPEEVKSSITVEQYGVQRTRDVPPNYLVRSLTPFFYIGSDGEIEFQRKEDYFNEPPKKKRKKNARAKRTRKRTD
jgi:hypothetical protein